MNFNWNVMEVCSYGSNSWTLVRKMAWRRSGDKPLSKPMLAMWRTIMFPMFKLQLEAYVGCTDLNVRRPWKAVKSIITQSLTYSTHVTLWCLHTFCIRLSNGRYFDLLHWIGDNLKWIPRMKPIIFAQQPIDQICVSFHTGLVPSRRQASTQSVASKWIMHAYVTRTYGALV